jgi:molybdopterin-guanine dinucleotide biosynthesis protein A
MGRPKHELELDGRSFLELAVRVLSKSCEEVLTVGRDPRWDLRDAARMVGPAAGIVAALDHDPQADWLVIACDQPLLADLPGWLVAHAPASAVAVLLTSGGRRQPFPGLYRVAARDPLAAIAAASKRLTNLADHPLVELLEVPPELVPELVNINRPEDLATLAEAPE